MDKLITFPWLQTAVLGKWKLGLKNPKMDRVLLYWVVLAFDQYITRVLPACDVLVALSGSGFKAGPLAQSRGGVYMCDRGSSHIRYGDRIMREEFHRWGQEFEGVDPRHIVREEFEYSIADAITVPSEFARRTFVEQGVLDSKIRMIPYGADLQRFSKTGDPARDSFDVLFVGQVSFRKGVPYLLEAFSRFSHPRKKLTIVGDMQPEMRAYLVGKRFDRVDFVGPIPHSQLKECMSKSHVMVLPSVEDGFGYVLGEALACGCPVISTTNTGGADLFEDGREGFIVPIRDSKAIVAKLTQIAEDSDLRSKMSGAALEGVNRIGGWDSYGEAFSSLCQTLVMNKPQSAVR